MRDVMSATDGYELAAEPRHGSVEIPMSMPRMEPSPWGNRLTHYDIASKVEIDKPINVDVSV